MLEEEPGAHAIYGCHPHFSEELDVAAQLALERLLKRPNVVGLGEFGLDFSSKNNVPEYIQRRAFLVQMAMAMRLGLPVCLHIRDATVEGFEVLEEAGVPPDYPMHVHCFTDSWEVCQTWLEKYPACVIGLTPLICNQKATQVREVAAKIPLDRLVLETDAPYFKPSLASSTQTWSHPGIVAHAAAQVAALKGISVKEVITATGVNARRVYDLAGRSKFRPLTEETFEEISGSGTSISAALLSL